MFDMNAAVVAVFYELDVLYIEERHWWIFLDLVSVPLAGVSPRAAATLARHEEMAHVCNAAEMIPVLANVILTTGCTYIAVQYDVEV